MKNTRNFVITTFAAAVSVAANAVPAGTVLFTQPGATIVGENGASRPASRGEVVQAGERLVTPSNGISQVVMVDGSLLGVRPGSELKFELPPQASDIAKGVVSLVQGSARVIGAELMDANKLSTVTLRSGNSVLQMRGADLETAVVKGGGAKEAEGSYHRLLTGTASVGVGQSVSALAPRQVSYVGTTALAPIVVATVSPTLFTSNLLISPTTLGTTSLTSTTTKTLSSTSLLSPTLTTSTLTAPLLTSTTTTPTLTTYIAPTKTAYIAPTTTLIAPVTTTYIAPTTTFTTTTYVAPTYSTLNTTTTLKTISTTTLTCRLKTTC